MEIQQAASSQTIATLSHKLSVEVKAREKISAEYEQMQKRCENHRRYEQAALEECVDQPAAHGPSAATQPRYYRSLLSGPSQKRGREQSSLRGKMQSRL
jgi:hypothetical protein